MFHLLNLHYYSAVSIFGSSLTPALSISLSIIANILWKNCFIHLKLNFITTIVR